jgi:hypothetical protein
VSAPIDGRGGRSGAGLVLGAGRNVLIANDILTADGNVTVEAPNGTLAMAAGPADSITAGQGTVISAGRGSIALRAGGDVSVQHLLSSTAVEVTSTTGSVDLARGFGGSGANRFEQGALTVTAANAVNVNGTIVAGGPVRLSGSDVVLRHSIFTNNQRIELGRAGGTVTLDPAGDERMTAVALDARTRQLVAPPPVDDQGEFVLPPNQQPPRIASGRAGDLDESVPMATLNIETRRITVDAGSTGADVAFLGQVVTPEGQLFSQVVSGRFPPDAPQRQDPDQLPGHFVLLDVAAGAGTVSFASGIAQAAAAIFDAPQFGDSGLQEAGGRDTLDLIVRSAGSIVSGSNAAPLRSFVNSFERPATASVVGNFVDMFRTPINVEAFSVPVFNARAAEPLEFPNFPPIFPEPNLAQPFNLSSTTLSFSLPGAPGVPSSAATTSVIGQAVSQAVREAEYLQDTTATEATDAAESASRLADMGRSAPADGAAADVFGGSSPLVRVRGRADESTQDVPYVEPDVFGRPTREDEESR